MQDIFGSVRRSLVLRSPDDDSTAVGTLVDKIKCIRKSRMFSKLSPPPQSVNSATAPTIRWRKGEMIGCGAFGQVYMGMNLDSGELLAVKQVLIVANNASKEKAQAHIKELEEEVKLLKNLSHPNIVRYLGTVKEEEALNILLEFVSGGSISSLLGKFGSFPEAVIRMYTKQLLLGLDYLHKNGIMHRDIKGANILVDNRGCIKLADFGASKQVVELATVTGAKSMKGTPYWMAPEVILQTGHSFSADIWSVGCTIIEMATGKPPWSEQYQEVAALFHIGSTKSHPPIPDHLSAEAKDFLLQCLQKEPELRPTACDLLQHPFVTKESWQSLPVAYPSSVENMRVPIPSDDKDMDISPTSSDVCNLGTLNFSTVNLVNVAESGHDWQANNSDDMCMIDNKDGFPVGAQAKLSPLLSDDINKSFNPMCEPDDWSCKSDGTHELEGLTTLEENQPDSKVGCCSTEKLNNDFAFHCGQSLSEDDDELTESKIRAFLDEKAVELKKMQTPLYEEFYNGVNATSSSIFSESTCDGSALNFLKLPPKSRSPSRVPITPTAVESAIYSSPGSGGTHISNISGTSNQSPREHLSPQVHDQNGIQVDVQHNSISPGMSFSEVQRKWKEELDQELERKREMMRQTGGGKNISPIERGLNRKRDRSRFASPGK
ncbi:Mitogen-activated protein kinase kinase kinase NPK1 [Heracleum sosnowskyi]|uniref:mitogen-activated protein kinase kinase kinase n=1 Tax=Heracleum sosnowskyi TaxID=360622 RepID=A0AAD8N9G6_9APIA|nr:Mitogen-activated protein kinase kinase kinase NPK1 [Heracleum sosnowskyi]